MERRAVLASDQAAPHENVARIERFLATQTREGDVLESEVVENLAAANGRSELVDQIAVNLSSSSTETALLGADSTVRATASTRAAQTPDHTIVVLSDSQDPLLASGFDSEALSARERVLLADVDVVANEIANKQAEQEALLKKLTSQSLEASLTLEAATDPYVREPKATSYGSTVGYLPNTKPQVSKPTAYPEETKPAAYPVETKPAVYPAVTKKPTAYPVVAKPAAYPVVAKPAAYPVETKPAAYPVETKPAAYPAVTKKPTAYPVVAKPAAYPVETKPAAYPVVTKPAAYPVETKPTAYPAETKPAKATAYSGAYSALAMETTTATSLRAPDAISASAEQEGRVPDMIFGGAFLLVAAVVLGVMTKRSRRARPATSDDAYAYLLHE